MTIKNISASFLHFYEWEMPDEEAIGNVNGVDVKTKGLASGNQYNLHNNILKIQYIEELIDYINDGKIIIVDGDFEFTKEESLKVFEDRILIQPPELMSISPTVLNPDTVGNTIVVKGRGFNDKTIFKISNSRFNITSTRVVSSEELEVDVDIIGASNIGDVNVAVFNGHVSSEVYKNAIGTGLLKVMNIPTGREKYLRVANSSGDNYIGAAFSRSSYSAAYNADKAFDNNNGSRHYSNEDQQLNHFCGLIMGTPTLLTKVGYRGTNGSNPFLIQGSNDTTNGEDGTWVDILSAELQDKMFNLEGQHVYNAFRLKWTNPTGSEFASAREIKMIGRQ